MDYEIIYDYSLAGTVVITNRYVQIEPPTEPPVEPEEPAEPEVPKVPELPKTGLVDMTLFTVLGTTMVALGGALLKKKK